MKKGFTLIELLVVVLIIGILSAIALPQYTKAVRKTRIAEAKINLKKLVEATDLYILQNGNANGIAFSDWDNLDIDVPSETKDWEYGVDECIPGTNGKIGCWVVAMPKFESGYFIAMTSMNYDGGDFEHAGKFLCDAAIDNGNKEICISLGGKKFSNDNDEQFFLEN